jgi:hypothetical protein
MSPAQQLLQPHGQHWPSKDEQMLKVIALIPQRLEGLIQLAKENHYFFSPLRFFFNMLSELVVQ